MNDAGGILTELLKWLVFEVVAIAALIAVLLVGGFAFSAAVVVAVVAVPIAPGWMILRRVRSRTHPRVGRGG